MEKVMATLLSEFASKEKFSLHLILIGKERKILQQIPQAIQIHKPNWIFNDNFRLWHTIRTIFFIRSNIKIIKPDTVLSFGEIWNNLVLLSCLGLEYPIFISDRSTPNKNLGKLHNYLRKKLYPKAKGFIAQTKISAQYAANNSWNRNIKVIGNPVQQVAFQANHDSNKVLTVGRLIPTKNTDRILEVFRQIQVSQPSSWELVVVGGDSQKHAEFKRLNEFVNKYNLKKKVSLLGERNDVANFYKSCSVFAFMSESEGFPNALAEAMAAGMAVIAYDCVAGPADMIDDGINGYLIPLGDEVRFEERLMSLINDKQLRKDFGLKARAKMKNFNETTVTQEFENFLTINLCGRLD